MTTMTNQGSFSVRLATIKDLEALTDLHCACFQPDDHVLMMLGRRFVKATYRWLISEGSAYALLAECNERIVGVIAVADGAFTRPMLKAALGELALSLLSRPQLALNKKLWKRLLRRSGDLTGQGKKIESCPGVAQMTIGAVDAEHRGLGVFPALVEATKTFSRQRGSRAIRAGIYKQNAPSRRVFIKGGWIETPELETPDTVFYLTYLDDRLASELGMGSRQGSENPIV